MRCTDKNRDIPWAVSEVVTSVLQLRFDFDPVLTALQINTIWLDVHFKLMSRAGLFGNSYSLIILHADMHSLVPFPCLSEQPWPLLVLAVRTHPLPAGALTALTVLFVWDRVTDTNHWFLSFFIVNKDPKGSKTFSLFGPSAFLPFLCLFPLLALSNVIPSAPSPSLGEPGVSTGASWALLFLNNFLLPPVLLLVFCNSQCLFSLAKVVGL